MQVSAHCNLFPHCISFPCFFPSFSGLPSLPLPPLHTLLQSSFSLSHISASNPWSSPSKLPQPYVDLIHVAARRAVTVSLTKRKCRLHSRLLPFLSMNKCSCRMAFNSCTGSGSLWSSGGMMTSSSRTRRACRNPAQHCESYTSVHYCGLFYSNVTTV